MFNLAGMMLVLIDNVGGQDCVVIEVWVIVEYFEEIMFSFCFLFGGFVDCVEV